MVQNINRYKHSSTFRISTLQKILRSHMNITGVERGCCREARLLPKRFVLMCLGLPLLRPNQLHFKFQYSFVLALYLIYTTTIILRLALVY